MNTKYSKEILEAAINVSETKVQVLKALGLEPNNGNYRYLAKLIRFFNISAPHLKGRNWRKGKTRRSSAAVDAHARLISTPDAEVFCENSFYNSSRLSKRLVQNGWDYRCSSCQNDGQWCGRPLVLHVDHINGISNDNRIENLRFLCPNCHQQTDTWGNKRNRDGTPEDYQ